MKYSISSSLFMLIGSLALLVWQWIFYRRRMVFQPTATQAVAEAEAPQKISDIAKRSK